jgi:hypothetical protein
MNRIGLIATLAATGALASAGVAYGTSSGDDHALSGSAADKARAAAVAYLGSGQGGSVEPDGEHGATYDVEVHQADGSVVDVWLDASFGPITSEVDEGP